MKARQSKSARSYFDNESKGRKILRSIYNSNGNDSNVGLVQLDNREFTVNEL